MADFVALLTLDGQGVEVNPDEVFSLTPVDGNLLPTGIPAGTYIQNEDGSRVAVQGTVIATAALLTAGTPTNQPRALIDASGALVAQNGVGATTHVANSGVYLVPLTGGLALFNEPVTVAPIGPGVPAANGISIQVTWSAPDTLLFAIFDVDAGAVPQDSDFAFVVSPV